MNFGTAWGNGDERECGTMIDVALDAGINFVDTADVYSSGESEQILGRALRGRRSNVVLATKFHGSMGGDVNERGSSRRWMTRAVEASLRRLNTDWIDLYQAHRPDPHCDLTETLECAQDLIAQGKIRAFGTSNYPSEALVEANHLGAVPGRALAASNQVAYSIFVRGPERAVMPVCNRRNISVLAFSPLNGGWLAGRYQEGVPPTEESRAARGRTPARYDPSRMGNAAKFPLVEALAALAAEVGTTLSRLAVAWTLVHPSVGSTIIGPRTPDQLHDVLGACDVVLDDAVLDAIDGIVAAGRTLNEPDVGWESPALAAAERRRPRPT